MKEEFKKIVEKVCKKLFKEVPDFSIEIPGDKSHGDYSTNIALILAKKLEKNPLEVANLIKSEIEKTKRGFLKEAKIACPGFINFFIKEEYLQGQISEILKQKNDFGKLKTGKNKKINIEFISANPTGPLTLGNGRGGFCGDVLANVLSTAGYKVTREYYINDTGNQIKVLGHSVLGDTEAVYKGEYIVDLRNKVKGKNVEEVGEKSAKIILEKMIKPSVKKMGIKFDKWFSEKALYKNKDVDKAINELAKKGFTYESEGAIWFKSKDLGDDKDRVLVRADGIKTYFASDIAYLKNKFKRGFEKLIIFLGADHYGYVPRLKAAAHAFGFEKENIDAIVMQLVKLFENGQEVRMSKRTGIYVTIDELIDEVGLDVARFFFLTIGPNTHFNFNLDLAKERSEKNPVFKVQYAYARINSIIAKSKIKNKKLKADLKLLIQPSELELIRKLTILPEIIKDISKDYQLNRLPQYSVELADAFHKFYENCRVISENKKMTEARMSLILATKIVLENVLKLMGVSTPKEMKRNEIEK